MTARLECEMLPSDDDVAFYREHGYWVSGKVLPDALIDDALRGVARHFDGVVDDPLPVATGYADWRPGDPRAFRNVEHLALRNRAVRALALSPVVGAIAGRLAGADTVRLWDDQLVWKEPDPTGTHATAIGWHADRAYWMTCTSEQMLTAWIPLHDSTADRSPLMVIDGSHRWPGTEALRSFKDQDLDSLALPIEPGRLAERTRTITLTKGQVSFHHCRTIHGSDINRSTTPRVSLAVHLQDGANRWRRFPNAEGVPWELVNDRMARRRPDGNPDYTDPAVFPVLWSQGERESQAS